MNIVNNEKGFKVLRLSPREARKQGMGTIEGILCARCNSYHSPTYYIAVLNDCMCTGCYNKWLEEAVYCPEDKDIEQRNFNYYYNNTDEIETSI